MSLTHITAEGHFRGVYILQTDNAYMLQIAMDNVAITLDIAEAEKLARTLGQSIASIPQTKGA
jgi:hypothetical protein